MIKIIYSKKYDKAVKSELKELNYSIHNEQAQEEKIILTLDKFPPNTKKLLKTDWEGYSIGAGKKEVLI
jgi:hypothetical protein